MNIFNDYESFYGKVDLTDLHRQSNQLLELAQNIRKNLGKQGYLLDRYLFMVLEGFDAAAMFDVVEECCSLCERLSEMNFDALDSLDTHKEEASYLKVKDYLLEHPLPRQEQYPCRSLYMVALSDYFSECVTTQITEYLMDRQQAAYDISVLQNLFQQISSVLGDETQMEQLNLLLRRRFQTVTPMSALVQCLHEILLPFLLSRDAKTGKQRFQVLIAGQ